MRWIRRVDVTDEGREVREYPVRRNVGSSDPPTIGRGVGLHPARVHGYGYECFFFVLMRNHPRSGDSPDAAHADVAFPEMAGRRNLSEPLDPDPLGQPHDHAPAIIQMAVPEYFVLVREQMHQLAGRASGLL